MNWFFFIDFFLIMYKMKSHKCSMTHMLMNSSNVVAWSSLFLHISFCLQTVWVSRQSITSAQSSSSKAPPCGSASCPQGEIITCQAPDQIHYPSQQHCQTQVWVQLIFCIDFLDVNSVTDLNIISVECWNIKRSLRDNCHSQDSRNVS